MKTTLIYFTGTGNSLAVSRQLAEKIGDTKIVSAREVLNHISSPPKGERIKVRGPDLLPCFPIETDVVGFVFPVYCQNVPEMVRRMVKQARIPPGAYVFAVATHNGDPGYSHFTLDKILRKKGQHLAAGFAVLMPGNSITPKNSMNSEEEQRRRIQASGSGIDAIASSILRKEPLSFIGTNTLRKRAKGFRNMFRFKVLYKVPEKFWATDACNGCGICAQICPEGNIRVDEASPRWGKHCQMCLACIHWCPQQAVQNGDGTIHRKRYHHPDIAIDDMLNDSNPTPVRPERVEGQIPPIA